MHWLDERCTLSRNNDNNCVYKTNERYLKLLRKIDRASLRAKLIRSVFACVRALVYVCMWCMRIRCNNAFERMSNYFWPVCARSLTVIIIIIIWHYGARWGRYFTALKYVRTSMIVRMHVYKNKRCVAYAITRRCVHHASGVIGGISRCGRELRLRLGLRGRFIRRAGGAAIRPT